VQSERLAAVGELAAGVAHEVNNPVNFALNALRTLRHAVGQVRAVADRVVSLEIRDASRLGQELDAIRQLQQEVGFADLVSTLDELVGIATEGLERTSRLVGDLRDFARPERGPRARVDIRRGIESTVQLLHRAIADAGAQVRLDIPAGIPVVMGDAGALNQIYLNLIKNALEAFRGPGGTVRIEAVREGGNLVVRFHDDGPGMEADVQAQLFRPFFTTKGAGQGSGLGLSISRRIAEQHGGRLDVSSTPGAGSCFVLALPAEEGMSGSES
jgi:signal transduction histidine kinase